MTNTMFLDAGQLTTEFRLQKMQAVPDAVGGYREVWTEVATLWGKIEPAKTSTKDFGQRPRIEFSHRITLRYRDDVKSDMRLCKGERMFHLISVRDVDETKRYLTCQAAEVNQ